MRDLVSMEEAARRDLAKRRAEASRTKRQRQLRREVFQGKRRYGVANKTGGKDYWQLVRIRREKKQRVR